jgi:hypothetical protein
MLPVGTELPVSATVAVRVTGCDTVAGLGAALTVTCVADGELPAPDADSFV